MKYWSKLTCQGQLKHKVSHKSLIAAYFQLAKWIRKYGKYGTMRFDIEAW